MSSSNVEMFVKTATIICLCVWTVTAQSESVPGTPPPGASIIHPGFCPNPPFDPSKCGIIFCPLGCEGDFNCTAKRKCCPGCCTLCVDALPTPPTPVQRPGTCPAIPPGPSSCRANCNVDGDCDGTDKCCSIGCGRLCTAVTPPAPKAGTCPAVPTGRPIPCFVDCAIDSDCNGTAKCCSIGCGRACTAAIPPAPKPGTCPFVATDQPTPCLANCDTDVDCPGPAKCCSIGCGRLCTDITPPAPKPGKCPVLPPHTVGTCDERCRGDASCEGTEKCCSNGCGHVCQKAVIAQPPYS